MFPQWPCSSHADHNPSSKWFEYILHLNFHVVKCDPILGYRKCILIAGVKGARDHLLYSNIGITGCHHPVKAAFTPALFRPFELTPDAVVWVSLNALRPLVQTKQLDSGLLERGRLGLMSSMNHRWCEPHPHQSLQLYYPLKQKRPLGILAQEIISQLLEKVHKNAEVF